MVNWLKAGGVKITQFYRHALYATWNVYWDRGTRDMVFQRHRTSIDFYFAFISFLWAFYFFIFMVRKNFDKMRMWHGRPAIQVALINMRCLNCVSYLRMRVCVRVGVDVGFYDYDIYASNVFFFNSQTCTMWVWLISVVSFEQHLASSYHT